MVEFLSQNAPIVSAFASAGGFFIWTVYAFLFYSEFRRRRGSHIFIHAAGDGGPRTECLVINLSQEPVHILCSLAASRESAVQIQAIGNEELSVKARAKQGPLKTGESLSLGKFSQIADEVQQLSGPSGNREASEQRLEVRIAAIHGLSDEPVGALRGFIYNWASSEVIPDMPHTEQKRSRRMSRHVRHWMEQCDSYRPTDHQTPEQETRT